MDRLISDFDEMLDNETLSIDNGERLSTLDPEIQKWIFDNYKDKLSHSYLKNIRTYMTKEQLKRIFNPIATKVIRLEVRINDYDDFLLELNVLKDKYGIQ